MLNIQDIIDRNHTEPEEVAKIRENIKQSFSRLEFQEGPHKYYLHNDDGTTTELPSVSAMTHQFQPHVDWDEKAEGVALKTNTTKEAVKRMWEENNVRATNNGTSVHLYAECFMHFFMGHPELISPIVMPQYEKGYLIPYGIKQEGVLKFYEDLFVTDKIYPVMPEAQVYMGLTEDYKDVKPYAGTFDMLFTYKASDGKWKLLLYDWKTNKELESEFNRMVHGIVTNPEDKRHDKWMALYGKNGGMALEPFTELYDEAFSYYIMQLSCYSMCLQQLGYEIADRKIIWLKDDGTYEKISVPDYTSKMRMALQKN